jgi:hypothetical protein
MFSCVCHACNVCAHVCACVCLCAGRKVLQSAHGWEEGTREPRFIAAWTWESGHSWVEAAWRLRGRGSLVTVGYPQLSGHGWVDAAWT